MMRECIKSVVISLLLLSSLNASADVKFNLWVGEINFYGKEPISKIDLIQHDLQKDSAASFADGDLLFFTKHVVVNKKQQSSLFMYNTLTKKIDNVTNTTSNYFLPIKMPNTRAVSYVLKSNENSIELWKVNRKKVHEHLYHIKFSTISNYEWLDSDTMLLLASGPNKKLLRLDLNDPTNELEEVGSNVGDIERYENSNWFIYSDLTSPTTLKSYNAVTRETLDAMNMPKGALQFSISPTGQLLTTNDEGVWVRKIIARGDTILSRDEWKLIPLNIEGCDSSLTKVSLSDHGNKVALLCPIPFKQL